MNDHQISVKGYNATATVRAIYQVPGIQPEKHATVLVAHVNPAPSGALIDGEEIKITLPEGKDIIDSIAYIRSKNKEIVVALPGMEIEIILSQTKPEQLERL